MVKLFAKGNFITLIIPILSFLFFSGCLQMDTAKEVENAPDIFQVRFETTKENFLIEAHRKWAPIGTDRFYELLRAGFFDDSRFFRVRKGFIAQFGISGLPEVNETWQDRPIKDDPVRQQNLKGYLAYAMTAPNTRNTQIYINLADDIRLDSAGFAPFARVIEHMEVVDSLFAGYGESAGGGMRGGRQSKMLEGGNAYLDAHFPKLDRLIRATILPEK